MTTNLHAHVASESADCDGKHGYDYIIALNADEQREHIEADGINDFHDLHFKSRVLADAVSFHAEGGARVTLSTDGFVYVESTEEGYRHREVTWCEDATCNPNETSNYDQFAEMMGY